MKVTWRNLFFSSSSVASGSICRTWGKKAEEKKKSSGETTLNALTLSGIVIYIAFFFPLKIHMMHKNIYIFSPVCIICIYYLTRQKQKCKILYLGKKIVTKKSL